MLLEDHNQTTVTFDHLFQPPTVPVSPLQKQLFNINSIARQFLQTSQNNIITLTNTHGHPLVLAHNQNADHGSSTASASTVRRRSQQVEALTAMVSSSSTTARYDVIAQQASLTKRNTEQFNQSSGQAGIQVLAKFTLKEAAALKALMPWTLWSTMKRTLHRVFGYDVVGTTAACRAEVDQLMFRYEYGSFTLDQRGK